MSDAAKSLLSSVGLLDAARSTRRSLRKGLWDTRVRLKLRLLAPVYFGPLAGDAASPGHNGRELRVFGLKRSGNHAILNWILKNVQNRLCFLNNARPGHHLNPFLSFGQSFFKIDSEIVNIAPTDRLKVQKTNRLRRQHRERDWLIYSYEDQRLAGPHVEALERNHDRWLGPSETRLNVLILRDPFNCFASRARYGLLDRESIELWKTYAREYLGRSALLAGETVTVSYNRWCHDADYRQELGKALGLQRFDEGVDEVSGIGGGSSFDSTQFDGRASQMDTERRWCAFLEDPEFRRLLADPELHELSKAIFGEIAGTERLASR